MDEQAIHHHWKEILNTINDGLVIIGPEGKVMMVNRALEALTGYSGRELVGRPCSVFNCDVCEVARRESGGKWCLLFDVGETTRKRCLMSRKDGSYVAVLKQASLLKDSRGKVLGAVETLTDLSEIDRRDQRIEELSRLLDHETGFHGMIGHSAAMQKTFSIIEKAAQSDAPVIIFGASGTGKELVARAIHELGRRREGPYIQLNCAALNESLLESELFGHVKGAFTGAYRHRQGRFEAAHGGDIFLDEIGDLPLSIQVKLLRVLETKQFERVGDHRPVLVDVRIIAATHRNIAELVAAGKFREDLWFRINVIPILLPPLRERMEDLPLLTVNFIRQLRVRSGKDITGLSPEAMNIFTSYHWPGNVRELKSVIEYAFVIAERGLIEPDQLPTTLCGRPEACPASIRSENEEGVRRSLVIEALRSCHGNVTQAAKLLGVSRVTVWNRMKRYGIDMKRIVADQACSSSTDSGTTE
jgi:two-component system, NtrC family, response regulator HydG